MSSNSENTGCEENVHRASEIFAEYGDFIYNVILSKTRDQTITNDLYQDFFLSLVSKPIPEDVKNIKSYLYKSITHDVFDSTRRLQRYRKLMDKYIENSDFPINNTNPANAPIVEDKIEKVLSVVRGCLSPTEAKAITLRYRKGCSNKDIAKRLGVKKDSVSRYICMGLKKIRQILEDEGN